MTDRKLPTSDTAISWSRICVTGSEAESFLQGQLTQDLSVVNDSGSWSLLLAPNSVVIASLFVTRLREGFALTLERQLSEPALVRLRRFLLRTDCRLELDSEFDGGGPFTSDAERIDARWPGAPEFSRDLTPHSFGGDFVRSTISFTKGCFTGQELVGRLDARGSSVPWRLVHVSGVDESSLDAVLCSMGPDGPQGLSTWVPRLPSGVVGLAIVHRTLLGSIDQLALDGVTLEAIA